MLPIKDEFTNIKKEVDKAPKFFLESLIDDGYKCNLKILKKLIKNEDDCKEFLNIYRYFSVLEEVSRMPHLIDPALFDKNDRWFLGMLSDRVGHKNFISFFSYGFAYCLKEFDEDAVKEFNKLFNVNSQYDSFTQRWQANSYRMPNAIDEDSINNYLDYIKAEKISIELAHIENNRIKIIQNVFSDQRFLDDLKSFDLDPIFEKKSLLKKFGNFDEYFADLKFRYLIGPEVRQDFLMEGVALNDEEKLTRFITEYKEKLIKQCNEFVEEHGLDLITGKVVAHSKDQHRTDSDSLQTLKRRSALDPTKSPMQATASGFRGDLARS